MSGVNEHVLDLSARTSPSPHPPYPLHSSPHSPHNPSHVPSSASRNNLLNNSHRHRNNNNTSHTNSTTTRDVISFGTNKTVVKTNADVTNKNNTELADVDYNAALFRKKLKEDIDDDVINVSKVCRNEINRDYRAVRRKHDEEEDDNEINEKRVKKIDADDNEDNVDDDVSNRKKQRYDVTNIGATTFSKQRSEDDTEFDVKPFRRKQRNDSDRYYDDDDDDDDYDDDRSASSSSTRPSRIHSLPPPPAPLSHNSKVRAAQRSEQSSPRSYLRSYPSPYLSGTTPPLPYLPAGLNPLHPSLNPLLSMQLFSRLQAQVDSASKARNNYEKFTGPFPPGFVGGVPRHLTTGGLSDVIPYRPSYQAASKSPVDQRHPQLGEKRARREYSLGEPLSQSFKASSAPPSISKLEGDDSKQTKSYSECSSDVKNSSDYFERRRKNNEAAKRSRDSRRIKEEGTASRAAFLEQENIQLKAELQMWRTESAKLHQLLYERL